MGENRLMKKSLYEGSCIMLTTKHAKAKAIAPPFSKILGCVKCDYQENRERSDGKRQADPTNCQYCNP